MKKEYSDLSRGQKNTYTLSNVITLSSMLGSMIIFMALVMFEAVKYPAWLLESSLFTYLLLGGIGFSLIGGLLLAYIINTSMQLYTDLDLEKAEKRVLKIKEALD